MLIVTWLHDGAFRFGADVLKAKASRLEN